MPIMDSADDMSGGESSEGSVSGAAPLLPGLVQRQDSANYQPRPPALAERQDSAQNLQACFSFGVTHMLVCLLLERLAWQVCQG